MILAGITAATGLATLGYNIFSGERGFRYQNRYNDLMMGREDDAVQRRVADLKKAGLSPVLAAGSPASASAVKVGSTPQVSNSLGDSIMDYARFEQDEKFRNIEAQIAWQSNQANLSRTQAEIELLNAQRDEALARIPWIDRMNTLREREMNQAFEFAEELNPLKIREFTAKVLGHEKDNIIKDFEITISANSALASIYEPISARLRNSILEADLSNRQKDLALKDAELLAMAIALDIAGEDYKQEMMDTHAMAWASGHNQFSGKYGFAYWLGKKNDKEFTEFFRKFRKRGGSSRSF